MQTWPISCTELAFTYDVGLLGGKQEDTWKNMSRETPEFAITNTLLVASIVRWMTSSCSKRNMTKRYKS